MKIFKTDIQYGNNIKLIWKRDYINTFEIDQSSVNKKPKCVFSSKPVVQYENNINTFEARLH